MTYSLPVYTTSINRANTVVKSLLREFLNHTGTPKQGSTIMVASAHISDSIYTCNWNCISIYKLCWHGLDVKCKQGKRRLLHKMCQRADLPVMHSPITDKDISSVLGSEFPAHADQRLSKIQSLVLSSSGPLIKLWSDLSHQGFNGESDGLISVKSVLDVYQQTKALVGNASSYTNEMRCNDIIDKVKFKCPQIAAFLQDILLTH